MMKYQQLTSGERYIISHLRKQGFDQSRIARQIGRHRSTICREYQRNRCRITDGRYRASRAERRTRARRSRSRCNLHYTDKDFSFVRRLPRQKLSPEQIVGLIRRVNLM